MTLTDEVPQSAQHGGGLYQFRLTASGGCCFSGCGPAQGAGTGKLPLATVDPGRLRLTPSFCPAWSPPPNGPSPPPPAWP